VFKIQANMDPQHRDRVVHARLLGRFSAGMKTFHVRTGKEMKLANALTFMASDREIAAEAWPGDVIGIHNHGTISIGDTFTEGEAVTFTGIPNFAPELFRRARLRDPLKLKQLQKGLAQLSEEGATQFFRPLTSNDLILGAVGVLQFDVAAYRLKDEYGVEATFEPVSVTTALGPLQQREEAGRVPREERAEPGAGCGRPPGLPGTDPGQPAAGAGTLAGRALLGHPRSGAYRFGRLMPRGRIPFRRKGSDPSQRKGIHPPYGDRRARIAHRGDDRGCGSPSPRTMPTPCPRRPLLRSVKKSPAP
jgi:hypothetical protein